MYIGIVGCIGVGKSRLTAALASRLGYRALYEPVRDNPYLDDFYADAKRWSFGMQIFMLTQRFKQHREIQELRRRQVGIVQDQIIFGDILYARLTHQVGFMDDRDYRNYCSHFETLRPLLELPDVIIHLETTVDQARERIRRRGRASEQAISADYLQSLSDLFAEWTTAVENETTVLRLDWNNFQPVSEVVQQLERRLKTPLPLPVR
ncbi:MAG: deoxynucleoside kinase [Candidatus Kerfeldbacteria bacterium]|nr:deoxynucleoside kinase [Candidatus Kerfeldbacteria bacterium]